MISSNKMLTRINLSSLLESLEDINAFEKAYETDRMKLLDSLKKYLGVDPENQERIKDHINDCIEMTEDELFLIGVSTGVRLAKIIQNL